MVMYNSPFPDNINNDSMAEAFLSSFNIKPPNHMTYNLHNKPFLDIHKCTSETTDEPRSVSRLYAKPLSEILFGWGEIPPEKAAQKNSIPNKSKKDKKAGLSKSSKKLLIRYLKFNF